MKLVVFGATGKIGSEVIGQSLVKDHDVTAFVRDPARLSREDGRVQIITGDVFDAAAVGQAVQGQDVVICSLGATSLGKTSVRASGTDNMIKAMKEHGVRRILVVSAMGVGDSWSTLSSVNKLFFYTVLRNARKDHEKQEALVKASGLDWTIVRPSGLTDTPLSASYDVGEAIQAKTSRISRADVAHFIVKELDGTDFVGRAITITN